MAINNIIEAVKGCDNFLISSHVDPEPDALGSELAVYEMLKKLGKNAAIINDDDVPENYRFFEGIDMIRTAPRAEEKFDAAIILDCPTIERIGSVKQYVRGIKNVINIDHHISNDKFGSAHWVDSNSSSTAEMIYVLYKNMGLEINKKIAFYIYVAILTDTGSFNYSNTSKLTHEIAGELLGYGISPDQISDVIYERKSYGDVKLLAKVLSTLKVKENGRIAYLVCTNDMLIKSGSSVTATQDFVNYARAIDGVIISLFIREEAEKPNTYKVSLRSKNNINVNTIAQEFGGGGHKYAAGCVIKGTLESVKEKLLIKAKETLKANNII